MFRYVARHSHIIPYALLTTVVTNSGPQATQLFICEVIEMSAVVVPTTTVAVSPRAA